MLRIPKSVPGYKLKRLNVVLLTYPFGFFFRFSWYALATGVLINVDEEKGVCKDDMMAEINKLQLYRSANLSMKADYLH